MSIVSGANENILALAHAKFDFSLVKVEVHPDFTQIGPALTPTRRWEAEDGSQHKIAQRLAVLFEDLIPSIPRLISAYGKRVSEILKTPGVNPEGQSSHGPFKDYIGADGTAIWAAATSGTSAIAVYLLAALLAHTWDGKHAVSIWVELIETRKKHIIEAFERHEIVSQSSLLGAKQEFSREELAKWDTSARAWLQCTEKAKNWERHQHTLISRNITLPFAHAATTYEKVVLSWKYAMTGLEDLLCERPQMITNAALMLAFQAWSLYPDMIVLGKEAVHVQFNDALIPPNGVATIGSLEHTNSVGSSRWSLTLSHLRYYGRPKPVLSKGDPSRIPANTLRFIAFGALLGFWHISMNETCTAAAFVVEIWKRLGKSDHALGKIKSKYLPWFAYLEATAQKLHQARGEKLEEYKQAVYWGQRRATNLLERNPRKRQPFFGLTSEDVLSGLSKNDDAECGIAYLRNFAAELGVTYSNGFIVYVFHENDRLNSQSYALEFASVAPCPILKDGPVAEGARSYHGRWFVTNDVPTTTGKCEPSFKPVSAENEQIIYQKSPCFRPRHERDRGRMSLPYFFHTCGKHDYAAATIGTEPVSSVPCNCVDDFIVIFGNSDIGLFVKKSFLHHYTRTDFFQKLQRGIRRHLRPAEALARFQNQNISETMLWNFLCLVDPAMLPQFQGGRSQSGHSFKALKFIAEGEVHSEDLSRSLRALTVASTLFETFGDISVSPAVISTPIHLAPWVPEKSPRSVENLDLSCCAEDQSLIRPDLLKSPTLMETFSCIAYLETGTAFVDPKDLRLVFALCCGNSIYVARRILTDPAEEVQNPEVHHLVGNVGRAGISFLVAPNRPEIREIGYNYRVVNHAPYDNKREDSFQSTSLHLSFSNWCSPLDVDSGRTIDKDINFVESMIQVYEGSTWVADLDVMMVPFDELTVLDASCTCSSGSVRQLIPSSLGSPPTESSESCETQVETEQRARKDYVSLDCWEELLDPPLVTCVGLFRARGNWAARLAAVSILTQKGQAHSIGLVRRDHSFCLRCTEARYGEAYGEPGELESGLPSICVD